MLPLAFRQIHLDFHTSEQIPGVGAHWDAEAFVSTLKAAQVNSVTCFSKCHHGMIYHDTRFEHAKHPHLKVNLLKEQVEACHAAGIRVPIYISVGFDEHMARLHPEWIEVSAEGQRKGAPLAAGWKKLCLNSPYIDYVSEQTQEVLQLFQTDGLFFDIIHQYQCCCPWCLDGMRSQGRDPEVEEDRKQFARGVLNTVRRRITAEVRKVNPDCLLFWNSGHVDPSFKPVLDTFSHLELESLPSGGWGYDHFPLTVRYARNLNRDYLGMTGKFHKTWAGFGEYKNQPSLEYEAFTALAEGGKVSIGDQLHPDGRLNEATYELIGAVYAQMEAKEPWCADVRAVTEIAIFNPEAVGVADGRVDTSAGGALHALLEGHYQFDIVDAEMDWGRYKLLILPDKIRLGEELLEKLRRFLKTGGKIIASHMSGMAEDRLEFALTELGVDYLAPARYSPDFLVPEPGFAGDVPQVDHVMYDQGLEVLAAEETEVLARVWHPYFNRTWEHFCSHRHTPVEAASVFPAVVATENTVYFAHPIFASLMRHGVGTYRKLIQSAVRRLLPEPLVRTNAPSTAHITLQRQHALNRTMVHVLHYIPEQRYRDIQVVEEVLPLANVELSIRFERPPRRAYLAPERTQLPITRADGRLTVTIPEVRGHALVVFE